MTNADPSEDNSILAAKVAQITVDERQLDRMQFTGHTSIPLRQSLTMDSQILTEINRRVLHCI